MNNIKKYLPSKKFITFILIIIIVLVLFFIIKSTISFFKDKKTSDLTPIKVSIETITQGDGNNNGIADYEERLWGLDPNNNGPENKEYILAKKKTLEENGIISLDDESEKITQNEILSREFLATILSLQQTGQLDSEAIKSISEAVGQNIESTPIDDIYSTNMLTTKGDSTVANTTYREDMGALLKKYENEDIGSELTLIAQGLGGNDPQALNSTKSVAVAYRAFGGELINIPVPKVLASTHLSLANNYEKTGQSIEGLLLVLSDPIIGMKAITNYKKYNDALISDLEKLSEILQ
jgi:hypothetical protein